MTTYQYPPELTEAQRLVANQLDQDTAAKLAEDELTLAEIRAQRDEVLKDPDEARQRNALEALANRENIVDRQVRRQRLALLEALSKHCGVDMNTLRVRQPKLHERLLQALSRWQSAQQSLALAEDLDDIDKASAGARDFEATFRALADRASRLLDAPSEDHVAWEAGATEREQAARKAADEAKAALASAGEAMRDAEEQLAVALDTYKEAARAISDTVSRVQDVHGRPVGLQMSASRPSVDRVESELRRFAAGEGPLASAKEYEQHIVSVIDRTLESHLRVAPVVERAA